MTALPLVIALLTILLYLAAAMSVARAVAKRQSPRRGLLLAMLSVGLLLHGVVMHELLVQPGGLNFGVFTVAVLHSWLLVLLALLVNVYRPVEGIYLITMPLAAIELIVGAVGHENTAIIYTLTPALQTHILLSLLAYSLLSISALQAILVSWQERALRQHQRGLLMALPSLQTMEKMLFELIAIGFVLLTLAIGTGFVVLDNLLAQHVAHKTLFTLMAWVVFACLLAGRHLRGWRGRTAVRFTLVGFALLLLGFIGSKMVLELILSRTT